MWPPSPTQPGSPSLPSSPSLPGSAVIGGSASIGGTVAVGTSLAVLPTAPLGVTVEPSDPCVGSPGTAPYTEVVAALQALGCKMLMFPSGSADNYHYATNTYTSPSPPGAITPTIATGMSFDAVAALATAIGGGCQVMPNVNYGSNPGGTDGAAPSEGAAWVTYANSTKGYGYTWWALGQERYQNGYYTGIGFGGTAVDLHAAKDPASVGTNSQAFFTAMKGATGGAGIKCGCILYADSLGNPDFGTQTPQKVAYNATILANCTPDFVFLHWYPEILLAQPSDTYIFSPGVTGIPYVIARLKQQLAAAGLAGTPIWIQEMDGGDYPPGRQSVSIQYGAFALDAYLTFHEQNLNGGGVGYFNLHNGQSAGYIGSGVYGTATYGDDGLLATGGGLEPLLNTPFPSYHGLWLAAKAARSGDTLVSCTSGDPGVGLHAVSRTDGKLAIVAVNRTAVGRWFPISVSGFSPAGSGRAYRYYPGDPAVVETPLTGIGASFSVWLAPYGMNVRLLS